MRPSFSFGQACPDNAEHQVQSPKVLNVHYFPGNVQMAGETLKRLRTNRGITVREVERASQRIVAAKSDGRFHISNGWLVQLENGASEPGICKLFTLSVIYNVSFLDLVRLYIDIDNAEKYRAAASSHRTQLLNFRVPALTAHAKNCNEPHDTETTFVNGPMLRDQGMLFPQDQSSQGKGLALGYIGLNDFTMYPLIRPGSVVKIDMLQRKLNVSAWRNEYERPIYFIELRNAYACAWCELHDKDLLLIPHHSSPQTVRRFLFGREAEIVGRVVGFDTSCVDPEATRARLPNSA